MPFHPLYIVPHLPSAPMGTFPIVALEAMSSKIRSSEDRMMRTTGCCKLADLSHPMVVAWCDERA